MTSPALSFDFPTHRYHPTHFLLKAYICRVPSHDSQADLHRRYHSLPENSPFLYWFSPLGERVFQTVSLCNEDTDRICALSSADLTEMVKRRSDEFLNSVVRCSGSSAAPPSDGNLGSAFSFLEGLLFGIESVLDSAEVEVRGGLSGSVERISTAARKVFDLLESRRGQHQQQEGGGEEVIPLYRIRHERLCEVMESLLELLAEEPESPSPRARTSMGKSMIEPIPFPGFERMAEEEEDGITERYSSSSSESGSEDDEPFVIPSDLESDSESCAEDEENESSGDWKRKRRRRRKKRSASDRFSVPTVVGRLTGSKRRKVTMHVIVSEDGTVGIDVDELCRREDREAEQAEAMASGKPKSEFDEGSPPKKRRRLSPKQSEEM